MSGTFSTFRQEVASGRVFSSEFSGAPVAGEQPWSAVSPHAPLLQQAVSGAAPSGSAVEFRLDSHPLLQGPFHVAPEFRQRASGSVRLQGDTVSAEASGLAGAIPQGTQLALWLLRDLTVPADLDPRDLAVLPHGVDGSGNRPGNVFTLDGGPPGIGATVNTVALAIHPGLLQAAPDGRAAFSARLNRDRNLTYDPRILLDQSDPTAYLPSGLSDRILTDLFLRQATVMPELSIRTHFGQRLLALVQREVASLDKNGDGKVTLDEVQDAADLFLRPEQFNRAAVTVEPDTRPIPLMPNQASCLLVGGRAAG